MEVVDNWDRPDGELGNGWIDAHWAHPTWWDEFELANRAPVLPRPDRGLIVQPNNAAGRGAFYRDFGPEAATDVAVSVVWSGLRPLEATPLLHVNPDAEEFGIGAWPFWMNRLWIGTVGRSPDQWAIIQGVPFDHIHGMHRRIELRSAGDTFSVWLSAYDVRNAYSEPDEAYAGPFSRYARTFRLEPDGPMLKIGMDYEIPASLKSSHLHGVAIDVNQDPRRTPCARAILAPFRIASCSDNSRSSR